MDDITRDYLSSEQAFIFSDQITIFHEKIVEACLTIVDMKVYFMFKSTKSSIYKPFDLSELSAIVMSPSNPMSAAFRLKDQNKLGRSHIVFQNTNMGLLVRFIQELECYWLSVEFSDTIAMTVDKQPISFNFQEITIHKQKQ
jgi:hypothetical protein